MFNCSRTVLASLGFAALLALPVQSHASTAHSAPGASCVAQGGYSLYYSQYGWAGNSSTSSTTYAICPIDRHSTSDTSFSANAYIYSYSSSYPVSCKLITYPYTGSSGYTSTYTTSASSGYQTLAISSTTSGSNWRQMMYCSLSKSYSSSYTTNIQAFYVTE